MHQADRHWGGSPRLLSTSSVGFRTQMLQKVEQLDVMILLPGYFYSFAGSVHQAIQKTLKNTIYKFLVEE